MKSILFFVLILYVIQTNLFAVNPKLKIFLSDNACINCYSGLSYLNDVTEGVDVEIIVEKNNIGFAKVFIDKFNVTRKYIIITTEEIEGTDILCEYLENDYKKLNFKLSDFHIYLPVINKKEELKE